MSSRPSQLNVILTAGSHLLDSGQATPEHDLKSLLSSRIDKFYAALGKDRPSVVPLDTIEDLQLMTSQCALEVVHCVHHLLDADTYSPEKMSKDDAKSQQGASEHSPVIGTRDLRKLRTLLTMVFRWGVNPLLARVMLAWPARPSSHAVTTIIDLTSTPADYRTLSSFLTCFMSIFFPRGVQSSLAQTLVTTTMLNRHMTELLKASMALGWLPNSLSSEDTPTVDSLRYSTLRLLEFLPVSQVMTNLGAVLSSMPQSPAHVRKLCSSLLSKNLLRPEGIPALYAAIFGEQECSEDPQIEKIEHSGRILRSVPAGMKPEEFFSIIVPRLVALLSDNVPATYRRAASFAIYGMLDSEFPHSTLVSSLALPIMCGPIMQMSKVPLEDRPLATFVPMTPTRALSALTILVLNTDPSPVFIALLLSQVVPALYALMFHMDRMKASDPVLKESVRGLLATWGRVVERQEGADILWSVIQSDRTYWEVDITGEIKHVAADPTRGEKLSLLTPEELRREKTNGTNANFLDIYPDPAHFVQYLKSLHRSDITSELFIRLLEIYHLSGGDQESDPMRVLLYLQMIVQMQTQLPDNSSSTNILSKPEHILVFVKHALQSPVTATTVATPKKTERSRGIGLDDLRIVSLEEDDLVKDSDSDDEEPSQANGNQREDDMTETAINLLLATLEANPALSPRNVPILNDIVSLLEPFSDDASESIRTLAREARMVVTVRLASTSTFWSAPPAKDEESPQEIYQKALKLLQDPILPVRAHGLLLLRQLVSSRPRASGISSTETALIPAIMSIFMQSVQEDDSYIFLNAVQGLSAMVDAFGKEVLRSLLETYTRDVTTIHAEGLSKQEVNTKLRVGEALSQVIRRCGDALSIYADNVMPRLISVLRSSYAPTVLRTSAISLLTECVKTSLVAVLGYTTELSTGMIDLLQVEMVPVSQLPSREDEAEKTKTEQPKEKEALDSTPTAVDSKLPPLRRAALHFWTLLLQQLTHTVYNGGRVDKLQAPVLRRAKVTLGYISSTDEDGVVRLMAREANEAIDQLHKAMLGM
ncbi:hypothetical protein PAXRUDRAFT_826796 [Paxillus rubicundulus Ve08.2h10]|uniref:RNA polymerase II assembly factor Rtp1 C-terminal domain-containing protein n=1 Tax=Paxillus rubicundulus Ve08.2h10 TaxID=930991 RepID=A0A0D0E3T0_9AGAM|nr:hypothetical protein PAXRUDRAFT_826796 [Paxillus rubicundulus Ve08.2h10]